MTKVIVIALLVLSVGVDFTSKLLSIAADGLLISTAFLLWKPWKSFDKDS